MLGSVLLYVLLAARFGPAPHNALPVVLCAMALVAVAVSVGIFMVRRVMVMPAENILRTDAEDANALGRWRAGYILILALSETIALHGLVLRFVGFGFPEVLPFFLASFILMLFFGPHRPANAIG
jgi:F0F1-type ATP synthase membrane subunit c/vacuolar-type H+-ATPase subunit K